MFEFPIHFPAGDQLLYNSTALDTTDNITYDQNNNIVSFFFGSRVLIPDDNILIDEEQDFEIGLDCTVRNLSFLVQGKTISFRAFVETDHEVRTTTRVISPVVS